MTLVNGSSQPSLVPAIRDTRISLEKFELGDLSFDRKKREVKKGGRIVPLSDMRYTILFMLACHSRGKVGQPLHKKAILEELYGSKPPKSNSFDAHICRLRDALRGAGSVVSIRTFYGSGFKLFIRECPPL